MLDNTVTAATANNVSSKELSPADSLLSDGLLVWQTQADVPCWTASDKG